MDEDSCRALFKEVMENYKTYLFTEQERDNLLRAEHELLQENLEKRPYLLLVRVVTNALEFKAHEAKEKMLKVMSSKPINELPLVCDKCNVHVTKHGEQCGETEDGACV